MADDPAKLNKWLQEAREALNQLKDGRQEVTVAFDGKQVVYKPADEGALRQWIGELEARLGIRTEARRRALGVRF